MHVIQRPWTFILLLSWLVIAMVRASTPPFKPKDYEKKSAECKAFRRGTVDEEVNIQLKYVDINPTASIAILLVHGWPGLWSIWSNQIQEFKDDYHLIVPDLRGYGESTHPGNPRTSGRLQDVVGDLDCILKDARVESAVCIGHDWGSPICYEAGRSRPDLFTAVVGVIVPYMPAAGPYSSMKDLVGRVPTLGYQVYFDSQPEAAAAELNRDIRRSIRSTHRTLASGPPPDGFLKDDKYFLAAWDGLDELPPVPFFSPEEEDYFVEQYAIQGYENTIQFYSNENQYQSWKYAHDQGNLTIPQPVLAIYPTGDRVADFVAMAKVYRSANYLPNLTTEARAFRSEILHGSHWIQLENPQGFNDVVRKWLERLPHLEEQDKGQHDEL